MGSDGKVTVQQVIQQNGERRQSNSTTSQRTEWGVTAKYSTTSLTQLKLGFGCYSQKYLEPMRTFQYSDVCSRRNGGGILCPFLSINSSEDDAESLVFFFHLGTELMATMILFVISTCNCKDSKIEH